jgi:hypothetical protein
MVSWAGFWVPALGVELLRRFRELPTATRYWVPEYRVLQRQF